MKYIKMWPNAVYYRPIKDIAKISRGKVMSKEFLRDNKGEFPVYSSQTDNDGMLGSIKTYMFDGEYITWTTDGANAGTVFYRKGKFSITNVCGIIEIINPNILTKYVFYALKCETLQYVSKGMGNPKLMSNVMEKIHIPIPPLPIQQEIVRILDTFTNFTAELTAELTARRKQYEYYRDELLTFGEDVPRMTLKDISVSVSSGKNKEKEQEGMYPVYGSTGVIGRTNTAKYSKEQILVARVGANAGFVHKANGIYDVSDNTIIVELKDNYNLQYVYYILQKMNLRKYAKGGGQPLVTAGELKKIEIPIPDINEQDRVVSILDKFTGISTSFDSGLPAEIAARQKQYEYYRERLLSFKESHR